MTPKVKTLLALALERAPDLAGREFITADEFKRIGIPVLSSCARCGCTLGVYNAFVIGKECEIFCGDCLGVLVPELLEF